MNSYVNLDFIAKRYGKLPSEVLKSGTTLDLQVADIAVGYERFVTEAAQNGEKLTNHSQDQLKGMIDRVKARKDDAKKSAKSN